MQRFYMSQFWWEKAIVLPPRWVAKSRWTSTASPRYSHPAKEIVRHDVGTGRDDPTEKMGPAYDTPSLLGLYRTMPYLHHGRAATLEEVLKKLNPRDEHGSTKHLSEDQTRDLVAFLKSLPYKDPEPAARKAGLRKTER